VAATGGGWVLTEAEWHDEERMLERIAALLDPAQPTAMNAAAARARRAPQPTLAAMAAATSAIYRDALARQPAKLGEAPIAAARCLAALGYTPWCPPRRTPVAAPAADVERAPDGALALLARTALSIRHTLPGRVLYRLTPKPLLDALRQRL